MRKIKVTLVGETPLLMNNFAASLVQGLAKLPPEEQCEHRTHRSQKTGDLYVPSNALKRALVNGATYSRGKGRASLKRDVAAALFVSPIELSTGQKKYSVDIQRTVNPATKGANLTPRPRLDEWQITATIEYDETLLNKMQIEEVIVNTGNRVGLLDYRPQKMGEFGRFRLEDLQEIK